MDDARLREFFSLPVNPYHRRYEALRAVLFEGQSQKEVAERFGFEHVAIGSDLNGLIKPIKGCEPYAQTTVLLSAIRQ